MTFPEPIEPVVVNLGNGICMRWTEDATDPADRFVIEVDDPAAENGVGGWIELRHETATARLAVHSVAEVHDRIVMSRDGAAWVRDEIGRLLPPTADAIEAAAIRAYRAYWNGGISDETLDKHWAIDLGGVQETYRRIARAVLGGSDV